MRKREDKIKSIRTSWRDRTGGSPGWKIRWKKMECLILFQETHVIQTAAGRTDDQRKVVSHISFSFGTDEGWKDTGCQEKIGQEL